MVSATIFVDVPSVLTEGTGLRLILLNQLNEACVCLTHPDETDPFIEC